MVLAQTPDVAACLSTPNERGIATMAADLQITQRFTIRAVDGSLRELVSVFTPGTKSYEALQQHVGGLSPGETKCVPPYTPKIGQVSMLPDRSLKVTVWGIAPPSLPSTYIYPPRDPSYAAIIVQVGGIEPAQEKDLPGPYPSLPAR